MARASPARAAPATPIMETVTIRFPSHPRLLRAIRGTTRAIAGTVGFGGRETDGICMAVDEACANIMRHGYEGRYDQPIEVAYTLEPGRLTITLRDHAAPFDPGAVPQRDLDEVKPGGLGLRLIYETMDEVTYQPGAEEGTVLTLRKYLSPAHEVHDGS